MDSKEFSTEKVDIATLPGAIRALRDSDSSSSSCELMIIPARPIDPASSPLANLSSESEPDSSVDNCKTHGVIKDRVASSNFRSKDNELNKGAAIDDSKGSMDMSLTYEYESKVQILELTREHVIPQSAPMSQSSSNESAKSAHTHLSAPGSDLFSTQRHAESFKLTKERTLEERVRILEKRHISEAEWLKRELALRKEAQERVAGVEEKWEKKEEEWKKILHQKGKEADERVDLRRELEMRKEHEERIEKLRQQWDEERKAWRTKEEHLNQRLQQAERAGWMDQGDHTVVKVGRWSLYVDK